jgi:hypothetical protein
MVRKALLAFDADGHLEDLFIIAQTEAETEMIRRTIARMIRPSLWDRFRELLGVPDIGNQNVSSRK